MPRGGARIQVPALPSPGAEYDDTQEAQFRNSLENTLQSVSARFGDVDERITALETARDDHETRITALESAPSGDKVLLARVYYRGADFSTSATSFGDVHATNAAVSFTVPASGSVLLRAIASVSGAGVAGASYLFNVRESTSDVSGTPGVVLTPPTTDTLRVAGTVYETRIDGLTPDASLTYKLGHRVTNGSMTGVINTNTTSGIALVLEVYDGGDFGG